MPSGIVCDKSRGITAEDVRRMFLYDKNTGIVRWNEQRKNVPFGRVVGTSCGSGARYLGVSIYDKHYMVHRIIWLYVTGEWPENQIDHIDGNPRNNRWSNLRQATSSQNQTNIGRISSNRTGFKGVSKSGKWFYAKVQANSVGHYLGIFRTAQEASKVYQKAAKELHGEFYRDN